MHKSFPFHIKFSNLFWNDWMLSAKMQWTVSRLHIKFPTAWILLKPVSKTNYKTKVINIDKGINIDHKLCSHFFMYPSEETDFSGSLCLDGFPEKLFI